MKISHAIKGAASLVWKKALTHKFLSVIVILAAAGGGYYWYNSSTNGTAITQYILGTVQKGTVISSVSGTGQVSALTQLDIKPKVSGDVISIAVTQGQSVKEGVILLKLDSTAAQKTVRDAQAALESAQLSLQKLQQPADQLSLLQAQNALTQARQSKQNAQDNLTKAYDDGFNSVSNAFIDLPGIITGVYSVLYDTNINKSQANADAYLDLIKNYAPSAEQFKTSALNGYLAAETAYDQNLQNYKNTSRFSSRADIDALISETYDTTKLIAEALKNTKNFLDFVNDTLANTAQKINPPAIMATHQSSLQSYIGTTNSNLGSLLSIENSIKGYQNSIVNADQNISEKTESLAQLKAGADPLDVRSQQLSVQQKQLSLLDAQETLADYTIRAPFDGIVAQLNVKKGDPASSGTAVVSLITPQQIAEISLNEVDVSKVKVGQQATLTFDAFPDLTITGKVAQVDMIGTASQGVVTYNVEIAFDSQNESIKPGMSVSASVITDVKQDVLTVSNSAVKSQGGTSYVELVSSGSSTQSLVIGQSTTLSSAPTVQTVQTGLSNDSITEITSGLKEGDVVIVRTVVSSTQTSTTQSSGVRIQGGGGFGL